MFMKFVVYKYTEIFPPLHLKPSHICADAMPRAKKGTAIGSTFKEDDKALSL